MTDVSPGRRAVEAYEIDDVFLMESDCRVQSSFNQTESITEMALQHRVSLGPSILHQVRTPTDGSEEMHIIRYLVTAELRVLRDGVPHDKPEVGEEDILAVLKLTFAADYICSKAAAEDGDAVRSFGRNALFHVWPYLREAVHAFGARMRLPRITLPMMKPVLAGQSSTPAQVSPDP